MLDLRFYGAAQTTTGSMHIIEFDGKKILLDCGLVQGKRKESFELNRHFPFDPKEIHALVLSHSHIDHSGKIPALVKQGFKGKIYATGATCDLCEVMLRDSAFLQERDVEFVNKRRKKQGKNLFESLYDQEDVDRSLELFTPIDYHTGVEIAKGLELNFNDAGHILGSAVSILDYKRDGKKRRLVFTGDLGQNNTPLLRDPEPVPDTDVLITESTYGDRDHPSRENIRGRLKDYITFIYQHRSKLIIPAFSVGRTQQLLYILNELVESHAVPAIPVFVDSPLSKKATEITEHHQECYNNNLMGNLLRGDDPFKFPGLQFTNSVEDSMKLNDAKGPMIIISASGMCEGGRILHHLRNSISNPLNIILITGFQAENTLGRRIVEKAPIIKIFGEEHELRSTVFTINGLSGHADRKGLCDYAATLGNVEQAFCVHGEKEYCEAHVESLRKLGIPSVHMPVQGQLYRNV